MHALWSQVADKLVSCESLSMTILIQGVQKANWSKLLIETSQIAAQNCC